MQEESDSDWSSVAEEHSVSSLEDGILDQILHQNDRDVVQDQPRNMEIYSMPHEAISDEDTCIVCYESLKLMSDELLTQHKEEAKVAIACQSCRST